MCQYIDENISRNREGKLLHCETGKFYILQGNWEHSASRAGDFVTAGSEVPGGLGAGPWL